MAGNNNSTAEAAMKMGIFFAIIGALIGYGKTETGAGGWGGAVTGFLLGVAIVNFIRWAIVFLGAAIGLFFAYQAIRNGFTELGPEKKIERASQPAITAAVTEKAKPIWFSNKCAKSIELYIRWQDPVTGWTVNGPWNIKGNDALFIRSRDSSIVHASSSNISYHALIPENNYAWKGVDSVPFNGRILPMLTANVSGTGSYEFSIDCDNLITKAY